MMNLIFTRQSSIRHFQSGHVLALTVIGLTIGLSGCATLTSYNDSPVPASRQESAGSYRVEASGGYGKALEYVGTLDGPLTVQTALERSGAIKKFRNMDVTILRVVEDNGRPLRMPVQYDPGEKTISPEQDYALLPGDRILVEAASNNVIDKIIGTVTGD